MLLKLTYHDGRLGCRYNKLSPFILQSCWSLVSQQIMWINQHWTLKCILASGCLCTTRENAGCELRSRIRMVMAHFSQSQLQRWWKYPTLHLCKRFGKCRTAINLNWGISIRIWMLVASDWPSRIPLTFSLALTCPFVKVESQSEILGKWRTEPTRRG